MRRRILAVAALLLLAGCAEDTTGGRAGGGVSGTVTVFAAASLTESFGTLGTQFEAAHPGTSVRFSFAASSALAQSIGQGAPADVFASAGSTTMDTVVKSGDAKDPTTFATNVLEIAVPPDNPGGISSPADLARPGLKVALCQKQVPCGATAAQALARAKVTVTPATLGADVKAVLTAVRLGEVDAGIVYRTDVLAAGVDVRGIAIPPAQNVSTAYPIAALTAAPNQAGAAAFVAYVLSEQGRSVLAAAGFSSP
jgi:molybdate transport system substrate-binding protein